MTIRLDADLRKTIISPICGWCTHLRDVGIDRQCDAFPEGIPSTIWEGESDHCAPFPGDQGIHFEARVEHRANEVARWFGDDKQATTGDRADVA